MSPLPTPEERRKRLKSLSLDEVLGRSRRSGRELPDGRFRSSRAEERERQRREASQRAKSSSHS